ncbi:MAG: pyridine nucleotide-disulfide oxidoreductase/dicluster-binding protein [Dehalobacterium sp.]
MDRKKLLEMENLCIQGFPPACTTACPVHVDVPKMIQEIAAGNYSSALKIFSPKVYFPRIIGRICDHPCEKQCLRKNIDESIAVSLLEKACVEYGSFEKNIWKKPFQKKTQRIAIIGGGLSGLSAAVFLSGKGYLVSVFEQETQIGGRIRNFSEEMLPSREMIADFSLIDFFEIDVKIETKVDQELFQKITAQFDAVYLGTGKPGLSQFSLKGQIDDITYATNIPGVFAGGGLMRQEERYSPITSISDGRRAGISIDRYLKKSSLTESRANEGPSETKLVTNTENIGKLSKINPAGKSYIPEEAEKESARCLQCKCLECVKVCKYLEGFNGYPQKYIREISNNLAIVAGLKTAKRLINSCTYCGLCEKVCPTGLNMSIACNQAREEMVQKGVMPPGIHDFPVKDMLFSNSDRFLLIKHQPGKEKSQYLFFPGCQLPAVYPEYIEKIYGFLIDKLPGGVGLLFQCCGAPAFWAGRKELFQQALTDLKKKWEGMGSPKIIAACTTCFQVLKENIPEMEIMSLWEVYDYHFDFKDNMGQNKEVLSVHDPCTTRGELQIQDTVRSILRKMGYRYSELKYSKDKTKCCGYGGLVSFANKKVADDMINERIRESGHDYLAYCAICREYLAQKGKSAYHILDLIYENVGKERAERNAVGFSQRRENRIKLKKQLLKNIWDEGMGCLDQWDHIEIVLEDDVKNKIEERLILTEDIKKAINYAEETGYKILDPETGHMIAHYKPDIITYWVEYSVGKEKEYLVHKAYSHRLTLMEDLK